MYYLNMYHNHLQLLEYGGKANNLARLASYSNNAVPMFAGLAATYMKTVLGSSLLEANQAAYNKDFATAHAIARKAITGLKLHENLLSDIKAFTAHHPPTTTYAVRSSAIGEDGTQASFAGQHDTFLGVTPAKIPRRILDCWLSAYNENALAYRESMGLSPVPPGMGVVIQKMVKASLSGVIFTQDPTSTITHSMVIEVVAGLGETLVSGRTNPSTYFVEKASGLVLHEELCRQTIRMSLSPMGGTRTYKPRALTPKLPPTILKRLVHTAQTIENNYYGPMDIEWATQGSKVYVLQARPMTTDPEEDDGTFYSAFRRGASSGIVTALAQTKPWHEADFKTGNILISEHTTPNDLPIMRKASGIITMVGGITCHAAIVSRELGIPCIVGVGKEKALGYQGRTITMNGSTGEVTVNEV